MSNLVDEARKHYQESAPHIKGRYTSQLINKMADEIERLQQERDEQGRRAVELFDECKQAQLAEHKALQLVELNKSQVADLSDLLEEAAYELERLQENLSLAECYISGEYWDNYLSKRR